MSLLGINQTKIYASTPMAIRPVGNNVVPQMPPSRRTNQTSFKGGLLQASTANLRTQLSTNEEKTKYSHLIANLDKKDRKKIELLLKNGILLNANSNDNSSTLDSLYNIITTPRAVGLDSKVVLKETVNAIANPFVITQHFGDIPKSYVNSVLQNAQKNPKASHDEINEKTINVERSGACVSASIEFNLAKQMPAEFARFAQELSSPKVSVDKVIHLDRLASNSLDAIWLLNAFEVPYKADDFKTAKLTLAPDKNAIIRAQIQNSNKDKLERSLIDVLMQSTFMNVGSQQTYDSLTDNREGKFNDNNKGLIEFEKTFTESIVEDKNKISVTYQIVDENGKLTGYETTFDTMKKHILDSLAMGENVIIGYTQTDESGKIINGHEITIVGTKQDKNGKLIFICNDTDDDNPNPVEYPADFIIPMIHHAGLPQEIVEKDVKFVDNWVDGINAYKQLKQQQSQQNLQSQSTVA